MTRDGKVRRYVRYVHALNQWQCLLFCGHTIIVTGKGYRHPRRVDCAPCAREECQGTVRRTRRGDKR